MCKVVPHSEDHPKIDRFGIWSKITFGKSIHVHLPASIEYSFRECVFILLLLVFRAAFVFPSSH